MLFRGDTLLVRVDPRDIECLVARIISIRSNFDSESVHFDRVLTSNVSAYLFVYIANKQNGGVEVTITPPVLNLTKKQRERYPIRSLRYFVRKIW